MLTYWIVANTLVSGADSCDRWIQVYDYDAAREILVAIDKQFVDGPVLVGFERPFRAGTNPGRRIIMDMSGFADDDVERAFLIWAQWLSRGSAVWDDSFRLALVREHVRNVFLRYGDGVFRALNELGQDIIPGR